MAPLRMKAETPAQGESADYSEADPVRIVLLFLTYDPAKTQNVRGILSKFIETRPSLSFTVVEIDNAHEDQSWRAAEQGLWPCEAYCVGGDNAAHEFTGWDKGWRLAKENLGEGWDLVLIANDALENSKPLAALDAIDAELIAQLPRQNAVLGWVDTFARVNPEPLDTILRPMRLFGRNCRKWLCTTFFFAPAHIFEAVSPLTTVHDLDELFQDGDARQPFRAQAPLSKSYQGFLLAHQTRVWKRGDKRGYGLDEQTLPLFKNKVRNIVNEHALGAKFWRAGVRHVNLTIFDRRPRGLGLSADYQGPAWRRLLKLRLLSQWQLLREILPPAFRRRLSPPRESR